MIPLTVHRRDLFFPNDESSPARCGVIERSHRLCQDQCREALVGHRSLGCCRLRTATALNGRTGRSGQWIGRLGIISQDRPDRNLWPG